MLYNVRNYGLVRGKTYALGAGRRLPPWIFNVYLLCIMYVLCVVLVIIYYYSFNINSYLLFFYCCINCLLFYLFIYYLFCWLICLISSSLLFCLFICFYLFIYLFYCWRMLNLNTIKIIRDFTERARWKDGTHQCAKLANY